MCFVPTKTANVHRAKVIKLRGFKASYANWFDYFIIMRKHRNRKQERRSDHCINLVSDLSEEEHKLQTNLCKLHSNLCKLHSNLALCYCMRYFKPV